MRDMAPTSGLSPAAYDRWWRNRISKEEGALYPATRDEQLPSPGKGLKGFSHQQDLAEDHLVGAGALVKNKRALAEPYGVDTTLAKGQPMSNTAAGGREGSVASFKAGSVAGAKAHSSAGSKAGSLTTARLGRAEDGRSEAKLSQGSYPRTPQFSQAGKSATESQIMGRLERLEQDLRRERERREQAEHEMKHLLAVAATLTQSPR